MNWIRRVWNRDRLERELDSELRFHVDQEVARLCAQGVEPEEARRIALADFGGIEPTKEIARDVRGTRWIGELLADLRYAFRSMRRHPAFAVAAILSLAIGIGANTAIFAVLDALVLRPLPVLNPGELTYMTRVHPVAESPGESVNTRFSYPWVRRFEAALNEVHASVAGMTPTTRMQVTIGNGDAELALAQLVTGDWFHVLGTRAQIGRLLTQDDDAGDGQPVAVLSDGYWTRRFARDRAVIGSTIRLNGAPLTIVGVAAPGFDGFMVADPGEIWAPTALQPQLHYLFNADIEDADASKPWRPQTNISWLTIVMRMPPAETRRAAAVADTVFRSEVAERAAAITDHDRRAYALTERAELVDGSRGMSDVRDRFGSAVVVLMVTVALVLLVACANLANLLMARSAARAREFSIRLSLGAGRGRMIRQLLTESLILSLSGGAASLVLARTGTDVLLRMGASGSTPLPLDVAIDWRIVTFAIAISIATGLFFGLAPALRFSRPNIYEGVRSSNGTVGLRRERLPIRELLVVLQVAVSLGLVVAAALFVRTLHNLLVVRAGFEADHLITAKFDPRMAGYTAETLPALRARMLSTARNIPGAQTAALAMCGTLAGCHSISDIEVPGRARGVGDDADIQEDCVERDYFATLGMAFIAGRNFLPSDTESAHRVAVVNETMARHFFGDVNVVGRHFKQGDDYEIVGVVRDSRVNGLREAPPRMVFYSYTQRPGLPVRTIYVRVAGNVAPALANLRAAIRQADRGIAVREIVTLGELAERSVARERLVSTLTTVFGLLAVAVACLGLYGMVSYSVARRTNEIGLRLALGASPGNVRWLVLREMLVLVAVGLTLGVAMALPALRLVDALVYGIAPRDPAVLATSATALAAVALASAALPAWRASRLDPTIALRIE